MRKCHPVVSAGGSAVTAVRVAVEAAGRGLRERMICNDYLIATRTAMMCYFAAENHPPTAIANTQAIAELVLCCFHQDNYITCEYIAFYLCIYFHLPYLLLSSFSFSFVVVFFLSVLPAFGNKNWTRRSMKAALGFVDKVLAHIPP